MPHVDFYPALSDELSNEEKFVILCSHKEIPEKQKNEASSLVDHWDPDWDQLLELADYCKVTPLVYKNLQTFEIKVPDGVTMQLRERAGGVLARNVIYKKFIVSLADLFREARVDVLFLKGAALMPEVYGDPGLRMFSDVDILIKEEDMLKVKSLLGEKGLTEHVEGSVSDKYRSQRMFSLNGKLFLDVHVDLIGRRLHNKFQGIDWDSMWSNKRKVALDDIEFYALDPVHAILYHCVHLSMHHSFSGLSSYVDVNEMIRKYRDEIDWNFFLKRVRECRIKRPVYYTLLFTSRMLGTPIPDEVFEDLKGVERGVDRWVFKKIKTDNRGTDYLAELIMFDRWQDTLKFVFLSVASYPSHFIGIFSRVTESVIGRGSKK
ncbi:nucleotidyltransferase family protein [Candidatus Omnitrophota bacterium]